MGIFISESGRESSLKSVVGKKGFSGLIFGEQEAVNSMIVTRTKKRLPFMLFIEGLKIMKDVKIYCEEIQMQLSN